MHTVGNGVRYPRGAAASLSTTHATVVSHVEILGFESQVMILHC